MKKDNLSFLVISLSIIFAGLIIGGAILYSNKTSSSVEKEKEEKMAVPESAEPGPGPRLDYSKLTPVSEQDHVRGKFDAPITIIEFSDFQCPFCQRFHPVAKRIVEEYPDQVRWVYRHFPLDSIHPYARTAAEASECAAEQGAFWKFADGLFENQDRLGNKLYQELAQSLGLNMDQFDQCVSSAKYKDKVQTQYQDGLRVGVTGTPNGFVNDQPLLGALPYEQLKSMIDKLLSQ
jgi:protein-disulfide isomerase